ncbi:hypothetical protein [Acidisoma sp.]|uniref:hypothetical protein n=1 Tax=Acidisoma sp. TaxID=1872115 RepID=UPI003B0026DE
MSHDMKSDKPNMARRGLFRRLALLGMGGVAAAAGLTVAGVHTAQAQGYPPLPPPRYEAVPPPPGPRFVWRPGHWHWNGYRYAWFPGHYVPAGPRYGGFIPGHWAYHYGRRVWIPPHWR